MTIEIDKQAGTYLGQAQLSFICIQLFRDNQPKNQGFGVNHGRTLKYRQLLGSRKKWGQSPQNWARTVEIKISAKMSKIAISRNLRIFANFDLVHGNGSSSVIFGPIHHISFAYEH